ncbi:MAG: diguanylate cyclase [Nitrincola sp.]|nr:diguanylate cyclase [Nitrincola sp.]
MYRKLSERTVDLMREKHAREKAERQLKNVSRVLVEERLRNSEDRFKALFASIPEAVFVVDKVSESIADINLAAEKLCGFSVDKMLGRSFEDLFHPEGPKLLSESNKQLETYIFTANDDYLDVEVTLGSSYQEKDRSYMIAVVRDISERIKHKKALEHLAYHDPSTGLPNKASLIQYLTEQIQDHPNHSLALVYLDIDNFNQINDLYGVSQGDQLLKKVAKRFLRLVNTSGHVYHLGGDEFVLIFA